MTVRPKVVALLTDYDPKRPHGKGPFLHKDGRAYTPEENLLILDANHEEMRAAAEQLADTPKDVANLLALHPNAGQGAKRHPSRERGAVTTIRECAGAAGNSARFNAIR